MLWSSREVRPLSRGDVDEALAMCAADPVANVYVAARIVETDLDRNRNQAFAYAPDGRIEAVCWTSANVVPTTGTPGSAEAFASRVRRHQSRFSSVFGPAEQVALLWSGLRAYWRPPIEVRPHQLLMAIGPDVPLPVTSDPRVRPASVREIEAVLPASIAMFTEEIGYPPYNESSGRVSYRNATWALLEREHVLVITENGHVIFKAEFGSVGLGACQVQGVWVAPSHRGRGIAVPAMAAVIEYARAYVAPVVSLYVNDFNEAAVATYERVGMTTVGEFMTVLI
ncbi:MAG: GNAT family N-acetyltransferase [Dermatophilus congolensis]|nr:GNAT family N-acetyltransferase [Dermatophilus congolensis]